MDHLPTSRANVRVVLTAPFELPDGGGVVARGADGKVLSVWPDGTLEVDFETTPRETIARVPLDQLRVIDQEAERWAIVDLLYEQQTVIGRVHDAGDGNLLIEPVRSLPHGPATYDPPAEQPSDGVEPPPVVAFQQGASVTLIHEVYVPDIDVRIDAGTQGKVDVIEPDDKIVVYFPQFGVMLAMDAADIAIDTRNGPRA